MLDRNPDIEAIVFANDQMAIGGYAAIKARGLEIGKDILVVGYDDSPASLVLSPRLTTVHNQIMDMGYHSVYEAINLVNMGKTELTTLNSNLIVRSSCGCGNYNLEHSTLSNHVISTTSNIDEITNFILNYLFKNYSHTFYYNDLLDNFKPIVSMILRPLISEQYNFDTDAIIDYITNLLDSPLIQLYFDQNKLTYAISEMNKLLTALTQHNENSQRVVSNLFNTLHSALLLYSSNTLYNSTKQHKASVWASMYITRDTLTYSDDEEACFKLIMEELSASHFISSYIYIYEDSVMLLPNGSWKIPKTLYLQACNDNGHITYLSGDQRIISSKEVFDNQYTSTTRRRTLVLTPLFTNNIQYGLFVGEIDILHFGNIYPTNLQLATSLNFIALMNQQMLTHNKLAASAAELNEKNKLLNKLSITDSLTGINNRRGFMDTVQHQVNSHFNDGRQAMLVFADMDNLKQVNDLFGHKNGDYALHSIAEVLTKSFSDEDIIGRIGGDEFVAFAFINSPNHISTIKEKISEHFYELNQSCRKPFYIDISLGITTFVCSPALNIEDILHNADTSLYESKQNKRQSAVKPY